jgi:rhamnopyranosyl-N-acetylglucosaminyl-diphospho-decaprenol beta-1,3/1,4-galactofuranosyltransferase
MERETCAAVVLTYNRLHFLKECVESIKKQVRMPERIIIVDNGSAEETRNWLQQQTGIEVVTIAQNAGPAAGMKTALQAGYDGGFTWIWIMDDDSLPDPLALKKLLEARPGQVAAKNSLVLDKDDRESLVFKLKHYKSLNDISGQYIEGHIMPWNGTLFHREVITQLGYPKSELFLWGEETEYFYRLKKSGLFPLFTVKDSYHFHPKNAGFFYKGTWDVHSQWRAYYFIRNKYTVFLSKFRQSRIPAFINYLVFLSGMLYYILFFQQDKWKKFKLLMLAANDGVKKDYSRSVSDVSMLVKQL